MVFGGLEGCFWGYFSEDYGEDIAGYLVVWDEQLDGVDSVFELVFLDLLLESADLGIGVFGSGNLNDLLGGIVDNCGDGFGFYWCA